MDGETHRQWENALQAYNDWETEVDHLYYGEGGYIQQMKGGNSNYSYSEIYSMSSSDMFSAQIVADEYCRKLIDKQLSIDTITYTGTSSSHGGFAYFEYKVMYTNGTTRKGTVTVSKYSGEFKATGMN